MNQPAVKIDIALLHYPVVNKSGETIGSAVTNLDLHDIARAARTYGVGRYYVVTPYQDQHQLIDEIIGHWRTGYGAGYNPARKEALSIVRSCHGLPDIVADAHTRHGVRPLIVATTARNGVGTVSCRELRHRLEQSGQPALVLFGTAHGLAPACFNEADLVLTPINGQDGYNHLSVRSAVSIMLDRLICRE